MQLARAAGLFLANAIWRIAGAEWAGRTLVNALGSKDENIVSIAGIFLAKSGDKAEPLLLHALEHRENLEVVLSLLGDIGHLDLVEVLDQLQDDPDPSISGATRDALRVLRARNG